MKTLTNSIRWLLAIGCISFYVSSHCWAQDVHFSQFYTSPLLLNPASAGTADKNYRFTTHYRNQWRSVSSPYKTFAAAYDMWLTKSKSLCGGLMFFNDRAGDAKMGTTQINLVLSSVQQLNNTNILSAGLQAGYAQHSVDYTQIRWDNQYNGMVYDPGLSSGEPDDMTGGQFSNFDFTGGIRWMIKPNSSFKMDAGISYNHIGKPKYSFYELADKKLYGRFIFNSNAQYTIENTNTSILPGILIQKQGPSYEVIAGSLVKYVLGLDSKYTGLQTSSAFYLGAHYRVMDALIFAVLFDFKHYVTVGVSYDVNLSELSEATASKGGFEVSLQVPVQGQNQQSSVKLR